MNCRGVSNGFGLHSLLHIHRHCMHKIVVNSETKSKMAIQRQLYLFHSNFTRYSIKKFAISMKCCCFHHFYNLFDLLAARVQIMSDALYVSLYWIRAYAWRGVLSVRYFHKFVQVHHQTNMYVCTKIRHCWWFVENLGPAGVYNKTHTHTVQVCANANFIKTTSLHCTFNEASEILHIYMHL